LQVQLKKVVALFGVGALLGYPSPVAAFDATVSLSSDLRGAVYLVEGFYGSLGADTSDENEDVGSSSEGSDTVNFAVRPSLHLEVSQQLYQRQQVTFGVKVEVVYASLGVRYPNEFSFQSGGRTIRFTEPSSIQLSSLDAGVGSFISFELSPQMFIGGEIMYVYQDLSIQSTLGSWDLNDNLYDSRIDSSIWLDYILFNNGFDLPVQPKARLGVTHRHNESSFNLGLRVAF